MEDLLRGMSMDYYKITGDTPAKERIIELQNIKKDLIDQIISNSDKSVTGITLEDISFILK